MKICASKVSILSAFVLMASFVFVNTQILQGNEACRSGSCVNCDDDAGCLKCVGRVGNYTNSGYCDSRIISSNDNCASWSTFPHDYCETCMPGYLINERN